MVQQGSLSGRVLAEISTTLVKLHRRYYGKGPTKAKTHMVDDTVICILRGGFTTVERTLIEGKNLDAVHHMRRSFQDAMEEHFTGVIEEATGRKVIAYMTQIHADPDLAIEVFVLEPTELLSLEDRAQDVHGDPVQDVNGGPGEVDGDRPD